MFSLNLNNQSDISAHVVENKFSEQVQTTVDEVGKALLASPSR